nr:SsgA family sporulation/cell division regulator [Streptomyces sp. RLB1-33]
MRSVRTVAHELPVQLVLSHDLSVPIRAALQYDADDPYAVRAVFHTLDQSGTVEWFLSRDMLAQALSEHTGHGDVRMWPTRDSGRDVVRMVLRSPGGSALLEFPAQGVESFLRETWSAVPPGAESSRLDLDAELAQLLAEN